MDTTLFFSNCGAVMDMTSTPPRELGLAPTVSADRFRNDDVQVIWPTQYGMPGQSYAEEFLLRLDIARSQPMPCICNDERPGDCRSMGCDPDCEAC